MTTIFNPSPMLSPTELRKFPWVTVTWLIVNEGELNDLLDAFGLPVSCDGSVRARAGKGVAALHNCRQFPQAVSIICTLGEHGIICLESPEKSSEQPNIMYLEAEYLERPVKDTTGAGDCFAGYFVAGLMENIGLEGTLNLCLTVSQ